MNKHTDQICLSEVIICPPRSHLVTDSNTRSIDFRLTPSGEISNSLKAMMIDAMKVPGTNLLAEVLNLMHSSAGHNSKQISLVHHLT